MPASGRNGSRRSGGLVLEAREDEKAGPAGVGVGVDERLRDEADGLVVHRSAHDPVEPQRLPLAGVRRDAPGEELVDSPVTALRHGVSPFSLSKTFRK